MSTRYRVGTLWATWTLAGKSGGRAHRHCTVGPISQECGEGLIAYITPLSWTGVVPLCYGNLWDSSRRSKLSSAVDGFHCYIHVRDCIICGWSVSLFLAVMDSDHFISIIIHGRAKMAFLLTQVSHSRYVQDCHQVSRKSQVPLCSLYTVS